LKDVQNNNENLRERLSEVEQLGSSKVETVQKENLEKELDLLKNMRELKLENE
jgi:hypothetical protein